MEIKNAPVVYVPQKIEAMPAVSDKPEMLEEKIETSPTEKVIKEKLKEKVEGMNDFLVPVNTSLKFQFHEELGEYYVQVVDTFTSEVIKDIPNKKFLDMYASMAEFAGLIVDEKL